MPNLNKNDEPDWGASEPAKSLSTTARMNSEDLEAFAQFLQMNGMGGAMPANATGGKKAQPTVWQSFQFKACLSVSMFASAILCFNQLGHLLE